MHRELSDIPGADEALTFLNEAIRTRLKREGRGVEHPIAVAQLLAETGAATGRGGRDLARRAGGHRCDTD